MTAVATAAAATAAAAAAVAALGDAKQIAAAGENG